jgi:hypothetical protein
MRDDRKFVKRKKFKVDENFQYFLNFFQEVQKFDIFLSFELIQKY